MLSGYRVRVMWECELKRELNANPEMKAFFNTVELNAPMDPREAFYGGRTNCRKMYHKCGPGEQIKYADVCSLYPWVSHFTRFHIDNIQPF